MAEFLKRKKEAKMASLIKQCRDNMFEERDNMFEEVEYSDNQSSLRQIFLLLGHILDTRTHGLLAFTTFACGAIMALIGGICGYALSPDFPPFALVRVGGKLLLLLGLVEGLLLFYRVKRMD